MRERIGWAASAAAIGGSTFAFAASIASCAHPGSAADRLQPRRRAFHADRAGTDERSPRRLELAHRGHIEGVQHRGDGAIERGIQLAPLAGRDRRTHREAHRLEHHVTKPADADEIVAALQRGEAGNSPTPASEQLSLARAEWEHINHVLVSVSGNISEAARRLGLHRRSLQRKLAKYPPARRAR